MCEAGTEPSSVMSKVPPEYYLRSIGDPFLPIWNAEMSWRSRPTQKGTTDVPLIIQCFPSAVFLAVVLRPDTSLPAKASEIAKHISFSPDKTSGMTLSLIAGLPKFKIGGRPMTDPAINPEREIPE